MLAIAHCPLWILELAQSLFWRAKTGDFASFIVVILVGENKINKLLLSHCTTQQTDADSCKFLARSLVDRPPFP